MSKGTWYNDEIGEEKTHLIAFPRKNCPICRLPVKELEAVHHKRHERNYDYERLLEFIRSHCGISPSMSWVSSHFTKHTLQGAQKKLMKKHGKVEAVQELRKMSDSTRIQTSTEMEKAYQQLTSLATDFTGRIAVISEKLLKKLEDTVKVDEDLKDVDTIQAVKILAKLHKESSNQMSTIQALRAPKIMVSQFLKESLDYAINITGGILNDICETLMIDVMKAVRNNLPIDEVILRKIFQGAGKNFKKQMLDFRRDQMKKAMDALIDLEKII